MKLSAAITALQHLIDREGDIDITAEGFFGEVCPVKFHLKNRAAKRNGYFAPIVDGDAKGARVVVATHS